jgi:hypothetical protein
VNWLPIVLLIAGTAAVAFWLWLLFKKRPVFSRFSRSSHMFLFGAAGYSVWCFEGGSWRLLEDKSAPGFIPGPPPAQPGPCEGYCVKVPSIRALGVR